MKPWDRLRRTPSALLALTRMARAQVKDGRSPEAVLRDLLRAVDGVANTIGAAVTPPQPKRNAVPRGPAGQPKARGSREKILR